MFLFQDFNLTITLRVLWYSKNIVGVGACVVGEERVGAFRWEKTSN